MKKDERPRRGRPPNDPTATRTRILEVAAEIFNRDGYFATDTNKIARAAGFAPATFYRHFRDKKDVFLHAYAYWVDSDWSAIEDALRTQETPRARARAIAKAHGAHHEHWIEFRRSMHGLAATDVEARAFHLQARNRQLVRLRRLLKKLGAPQHPPGDLLYRFLAIERAANAIADGELAILRIPRRAVVHRIEREILYLLTGDPRSA